MGSHRLPKEVDLTAEDLRAVVEFALTAARSVLPLYVEACPDSPMPQAALNAAQRFVDGEPRSNLQRRTAVDAHRAAKAAPTTAASRAAYAAGDAAAAAYLHPLPKATQVGHILRASAYAAAAVEADGSAADAERFIAAEIARMPAAVLDVLRRYPPAPKGKTRVAQLMFLLDATLRPEVFPEP